MTASKKKGSTRRDFLGNTGKVAAVSAFAGMAVPLVHAADSSMIQLALVGCGGRGTGAAANALGVRSQPVKLVAMADVYENRLQSSFNDLNRKFTDKNFDVPKDRQFIGFDAYKSAIDCLKPGDIAIFTTPLAFRWVHFTYAIEKGVHVFMEKPLTADAPTSRRMLELGKKASAKGLKVGVGLMSRHQRALQEAQKRIADGEIGDIVSMRGYRMAGGNLASFRSHKWPGTGSELLWQISRFHSFLWASGGAFNDYYIHIVDHLCWMKGSWPVKAQATGGRHYRGDYVDQNFDSYGVEYTFDDGAKLHFDGRCMDGAEPIYASYAHGTKGSAVLSASGDCGLPSSTYTTQKPDGAKKLWESKVAIHERNPYDNEWNDLIEAIRNDKPYSEVEYGVMASMTGTLGRVAAHTGREWTMDNLMKSNVELAPGCDKWTMDSPPPIKCDENGRYPVPQPGIITDREYDDKKTV
ncbi:MAG: Gfo/Idh/MocA family oxidoreductase [Phycisphaeraceae bacterium]